MEMTENLNEKEPKIYEIGYLLSPLVAEEKLAETVNTVIRKVVEDAGAKVTAETAPAMRALAYEVRKETAGKAARFTDAYFGAIRFEARPSMIAVINEHLDRAELVIRFMTIIAPKDNPPRAPRRPVTAKPAAKAPVDGDVEKTPMKTEEIDAEIEGMLAKV